MNLDLIFESQEVRLACAGYVLLSEAIKISPEDQERFEEYIAKWDAARYDKWFKGEERIYLPFEKDASQAVEAPEELVDFLDGDGYVITDYGKGLCRRRNGKQDEKIGKVLNKIKAEYESREDKFGTLRIIQKADILLKSFETDKRRGGGKEPLEIVISRHPLDIAKMSDTRGWEGSSCMRTGGAHHDKVMCDVDEGTLIAYLAKVSDKDLENPVGRILIKPYINRDDPKDIMLVNTRMVYGANPPGFVEAIDKWLNSVQGSKQGIFDINPKLYHDRPGGGQGKGEGESATITRFDEDAILEDPSKVKYSVLVAWVAKNLAKAKASKKVMDHLLSTADDDSAPFLANLLFYDNKAEEIPKDLADQLEKSTNGISFLFKRSSHPKPEWVKALLDDGDPSNINRVIANAIKSSWLDEVVDYCIKKKDPLYARFMLTDAAKEGIHLDREDELAEILVREHSFWEGIRYMTELSKIIPSKGAKIPLPIIKRLAADDKSLSKVLLNVAYNNEGHIPKEILDLLTGKPHVAIELINRLMSMQPRYAASNAVFQVLIDDADLTTLEIVAGSLRRNRILVPAILERAIQDLKDKEAKEAGESKA